MSPSHKPSGLSHLLLLWKPDQSERPRHSYAPVAGQQVKNNFGSLHWVDSTPKELRFPSWRNVAWKVLFVWGPGRHCCWDFAVHFGQMASFPNSTRRTSPALFPKKGNASLAWEKCDKYEIACFKLTFGQFGFQALGRNNNNFLHARHASELSLPAPSQVSFWISFQKSSWVVLIVWVNCFLFFHQPNFFVGFAGFFNVGSRFILTANEISPPNTNLLASSTW